MPVWSSVPFISGARGLLIFPELGTEIAPELAVSLWIVSDGNTLATQDVHHKEEGSINLRFSTSAEMVSIGYPQYPPPPPITTLWVPM